MSTQKLNKEIVGLAIPNIISNVSVPLISSVDTALMGNLSSQHIAAVGLGSMIFNFIYWNFGFLRMGTTGLTAQAFGAKDSQAIIHTLLRALLLAILFGSIIVILQYPLQWAGFYLMNVEVGQCNMIGQYFQIRIWAAPLTLALITMMGWFFGMQNAWYPLLLTLLVNVVNMLVSYYLVVQAGWGIAGVAWGTVAAQFMGLLGALFLWWYRYSAYRESIDRRLFWAKEAFRAFLQVNSDIFLRTLCLTISFGFFASQSAGASEMVLATNTVLLQFTHWTSFCLDGFAYAAESLVGKYIGAQKAETVKRVIRYTLWWGLGLAVLNSFIYIIWGQDLLRIFSDDVELHVLAQEYLIYLIILPILAMPCYLFDGIFVGLTAVKSMRNSMFVALFAFLLSFYIGIHYYGNDAITIGHMLWTGLLVFLVTRGLAQGWMYQKKGLELK